MRKAEVEVGGYYIAKVSGKLTTVRIGMPRPQGGWNATNVETGRSVLVRSAARLRGKALAPSDQHSQLMQQQREMQQQSNTKPALDAISQAFGIPQHPQL